MIVLDPNRIRRQINQRLSLRAPQERSLEILHDILTTIEPSKDIDLEAALKAIKCSYSSVTDFERDFPSLCFALATGVGKTRLMGAFMAYLSLTGRSQNFFVLAPNTTIYDKLIDDISNTSSPKYVFRGISQFAQSPPVIVTGDTWEEGRGVRGPSGDLFGGSAVINIFNVDKINKQTGRIKGFRETIGDSYFDYLAGLDDLVMLMDEAHRYRAKAAFKAITELKPILGLELTATPKTTGANGQPFKNVIYDYGLANAMADGFIKEPAVATRENFRKEDYDADQLEQIMLEDGVHYHEDVKAKLDLYARENGVVTVHPFMLVVAQDTAHASALRAHIESDAFFSGAYNGKVIEVHSNQRGDEKDEAIERLVNLEHDNSTEIVIHVNKLKEGWDVTNLYTIVPLRASASDILTEQTLGRGLRLPYGKRTGNEAVDTLTVIAHDRFDEVVQRAREDGSIVKMKQITIGENGDVGNKPLQVIETPSYVEMLLTGKKTASTNAQSAAESGLSEAPQEKYVFDGEQERKSAGIALEIIKSQERSMTGGLSDLKKPEVVKKIAEGVRRAMERDQGELEGIVEKIDQEKLVAAVAATLIENTIEIPEIIVLPTREVNFSYKDFDLDVSSATRYQPISNKIIIRQLRDESQRVLERTTSAAKEDVVENYIVRHLIDHNEIDYDTHSDLLYKLAGQVVAHLRSYLSDDDDIESVALEKGKELAAFIFQQMKAHLVETPVDYNAKLVRSFRVLEPRHFGFSAGKVLNISQPANPLSETKRHLFVGTKKSAYSQHKFDSDPERRFAFLIDSDREDKVLRWIKPGLKQFEIEYRSGKPYNPDFVVETEDRYFIVEVKADNEMTDDDVLAKQTAAVKWVEYANKFAADSKKKPWAYALLSENSINESATFAGLMSVAKC